MDIMKVIDIATKLNVPGLVERGAKIAAEAVAYAALVKTNAARAGHMLAAGDASELDAIHAETLAAADELDAKLAAAAGR